MFFGKFLETSTPALVEKENQKLGKSREFLMWSRLKYSLIHFGDSPSGGLQLSPPSSSNGGGYVEISRGCWRLLDVVFSGLGGSSATES